MQAIKLLRLLSKKGRLPEEEFVDDLPDLSDEQNQELRYAQHLP